MRKGIFQAVVAAVQDLQVSQAVADVVQPLIKGVFSGGSGARAIKEGIHGDWLGHPLHPVLTDFPVGAWTAAAIFDALPGGEGAWQTRAADACVGIGLAFAVPTALTGLTDWSETSGRPARVGVAHATCNVVATAFYGSSLFVRPTDRRRGRLLSNCGFGALLLGGLLGGHLVFSQSIGVDPEQKVQPKQFDERVPTNRGAIFEEAPIA